VIILQTLPKGLLCSDPETTSSSWTVLGQDVALPCTVIRSLRQPQPPPSGLLLVITGWSCAVAACYITHAKDRAQGMIVLSVYISSLWLALTAPESSSMHVTFWGITCGLLLSDAFHNICSLLFKTWLLLRGDNTIQCTDSQMWTSQDTKDRPTITDV
jgi:hypothetical protein